jgi:hypothetical protein
MLVTEVCSIFQLAERAGGLHGSADERAALRPRPM